MIFSIPSPTVGQQFSDKMVVCLGVASVALATGGAGVIGPALSSVGSFVGSLFGPAASTSVAVQTIGAGVSGVVAGASTSGTMAGTVAGGSLAAGVTATKAGKRGQKFNFFSLFVNL